ncbi:MAG: DUF6569 family protein [Fimbriimonadaceae bacterium]
MNKTHLAGVLAASFVAFAAIGCSSSVTVGNPDDPTVHASFRGATVPDFEDLSLGDAIQEGSLVLIPVSSKPQDSHGEIGEYATLAEAVKNGWIEIEEVSEYAEVDTLRVHYTGPKPLILMAGELLLGGKQDRVVAKDVVIAPNETAEVAVFCVEPGRWSGSSMHFTPQDGQVPLSVKREAMLGEQESVWASVGEYNAESAPNAGGSSLKYGYSESKDSDEYQASLEKLMGVLSKEKDLVGVVIVIGGKIHSFEYFGSPKLFESASESIVRGALASSVLVAVKGDLPKTDSITDFVSSSLNSLKNARASDQNGGFARTVSEDLSVSGGALADPEGGDLLHGSFFNNERK